MIKVLISKKDNNINKIIIKGHAYYDEYGKDIVCAAVSSTVITTVNGIKRIDKNAIEYLEEKDKLSIAINKNDDVTNKLIINMISLLKELESEYSKYIKIQEEV